MIDNLDFEKARSESKLMLENLEVWIRNIIDLGLADQYGMNFFDYVDGNGDRLIANSIIRDAKERFTNEPARYPRFVDSLLLDDIIKIVCKPNLYNDVFKEYFQTAFPEGNEEARTFMNRLIPIRNKLYHSNPISTHEAQRVMCYSNDIIASIKYCYKEKNMDKKHNAPTIIKITDSCGNQFSESQISRNTTGRGRCEARNDNSSLTVGDKLIIELEIDPSFDPSEYTLKWSFHPRDNAIISDSGNRLELTLENKHVSTDFNINCLVISNKEWHRCGDVDDAVVIQYQINPNE